MSEAEKIRKFELSGEYFELITGFQGVGPNGFFGISIGNSKVPFRTVWFNSKEDFIFYMEKTCAILKDYKRPTIQ